MSGVAVHTVQKEACSGVLSYINFWDGLCIAVTGGRQGGLRGVDLLSR